MTIPRSKAYVERSYHFNHILLLLRHARIGSSASAAHWRKARETHIVYLFMFFGCLMIVVSPVRTEVFGAIGERFR